MYFLNNKNTSNVSVVVAQGEKHAITRDGFWFEVNSDINDRSNVQIVSSKAKEM